MAAKLKLLRVGTKSKPKYRLIVQETRTKVGGKNVEILGEYNPRSEPPLINFKKEQVEKWIKLGAQTTDKVRYLLGKAGIMPPMDTSKLVQRKPKKEAPAAEAKPEIAAPPSEKAPEAAA